MDISELRRLGTRYILMPVIDRLRPIGYSTPQRLIDRLLAGFEVVPGEAGEEGEDDEEPE